MVLNSWILLSSCGAKCTHKDFRLLLVRNLIEEAGRSHYRPTPVWLEGQVQLQQMLWGWTAAIISIGQQNTKTIYLLPCLFRAGPAKDHYIHMCQIWCGSVRGAVFRWVPQKNKFVMQFYYKKRVCVCVCVCVCVRARVRCVVTEERLKVPRNLCSSQNYESNKIFTLHFINCMQLERPKFITKIREHFLPNWSIHKHAAKFYFLTFGGKVYKIWFFSRSKRWKLKPRSKNLGMVALGGGI